MWYVYFVKCAEEPFLQVGITTDLHGKLSSLEQGALHPTPCEVEATISVKTEDDARKIELAFIKDIAQKERERLAAKDILRKDFLLPSPPVAPRVSLVSLCAAFEQRSLYKE